MVGVAGSSSTTEVWSDSRCRALLVTSVLLASTLVLAPVTRGNRSWLIWGSLSLQPSELAKLGLIVALAR